MTNTSSPVGITRRALGDTSWSASKGLLWALVERITAEDWEAAAARTTYIGISRAWVYSRHLGRWEPFGCPPIVHAHLTLIGPSDGWRRRFVPQFTGARAT